jgi:hypothetical protein
MKWDITEAEIAEEQKHCRHSEFEYEFRKNMNFHEEEVSFRSEDYKQGTKHICGEITVKFKSKDDHKEFARHFPENPMFWSAKYGTNKGFIVKFVH